MINKIIAELYSKNIPQKIYHKLKRKLPNSDDMDDYYQQMYLILLETPQDKLLDLHKQGKLPDYFARICINQLVNKNSDTHKLLQTKWIKQNEIDNDEEPEPEFDFSVV